MKLQKSIALGALFLCNLALADTAVIVQSTPVYQTISTTQNRCTVERGRLKDNTREIGIGSLIGAAIGAQHDTASAIAGLLIGGFIADKASEGPRDYEKCVPETRYTQTVIGYDVKYVFNNREYVQRLDYDPGVGTRVEVRTTIGR
jgi:uncharacterized protein YcfJ